MHRITRIAIAALASVGMLASVAACGSGQSTSEKKGTIEVVASVNQWGTMAKTLGGDNVNVTSIINSTNVDAHDYERPRRISPNCRKRKSSSSMEPATTRGRSKRRKPPTQPSSTPLKSAG